MQLAEVEGDAPQPQQHSPRVQRIEALGVGHAQEHQRQDVQQGACTPAAMSWTQAAAFVLLFLPPMRPLISSVAKPQRCAGRLAHADDKHSRGTGVAPQYTHRMLSVPALLSLQGVGLCERLVVSLSALTQAQAVLLLSCAVMQANLCTAEPVAHPVWR